MLISRWLEFTILFNENCIFDTIKYEEFRNINFACEMLKFGRAKSLNRGTFFLLAFAKFQHHFLRRFVEGYTRRISEDIFGISDVYQTEISIFAICGLLRAFALEQIHGPLLAMTNYGFR